MLNSRIPAAPLYDNQAHVEKLAWLLVDDYYHHNLHRATENEVLILISQIISPNFRIKHIHGHQDE